MTNTKDLFEITESSGSVVFDLRYFPFFVVHLKGTLTISLIDSFTKARGEVFARARAEGKKTVQITDMTNFTTPSAVVRKQMGDVGMQQDREFPDVFAGYVLVVPNAVVRGVITALKWFAGDQATPNVVVASVKDAFAKDHTGTLGVDLRSVSYVPPDI